MKTNAKKIAPIALLTVAALILCAVVTGVLNALLAGGEWTFGWTDYRYDETEYQTGEGTIPSAALEVIDVDWADGMVLIVPCQDANLSITEESESDLTDASRLRWRLSENGRTLSVRYRDSSWFLDGKNKTLTVRVPVTLFEQLRALNVRGDSCNVFLRKLEIPSVSVTLGSGSLAAVDCSALALSASTKSGDVTWSGAVRDNERITSKSGDLTLSHPVTPQSSELSTRGGRITLALPEHASFALLWESKKGSVASDLPLTESDGAYLSGDGKATLRVKTEKGDLIIKKRS